MIETIAEALYQSPLISISAAFIWGVMSVLLSPCHLSTIPMIIAFVNHNQLLSVRKGFYVSLCFAGGIMLTLIALVILVMMAGFVFSGVDAILKIMVSVVLFVGGLYFVGLFPDMQGSQLMNYQITEHPFRSVFFAGIIIGTGLGSCALAFMAPVISIGISNLSNSPLFSLGLMLSFVLGHCLIIGVSGLFVGKIKDFFKWGKDSRGTKLLKYFSGGLMILFAIYNIVN